MRTLYLLLFLFAVCHLKAQWEVIPPPFGFIMSEGHTVLQPGITHYTNVIADTVRVWSHTPGEAWREVSEWHYDFQDLYTVNLFRNTDTWWVVGLERHQGHLWTSTDLSTWSYSPLPISDHYYRPMIIDDQLVLQGRHKVIRLEDENNWSTLLNLEEQIYHLRQVPQQGLLATTINNIYRLPINATEWELLPVPYDTDGVASPGLYIHPYAAGAFVGESNGLGGFTHHRTLDFGATWDTIPLPLSSDAFWRQTFTYRDTLWLNFGEQLAWSIDNGDSWEAQRLPDGTLEVGLWGDTIVSASHNGLFRSVDRGAHWYTANLGIPDQYRSDINQDGLFAVHDDLLIYDNRNGLFISNDLGQNWEIIDISFTDYNHILADGNTLVLLGRGTLQRSFDGGTQWEAIDYSAESRRHPVNISRSSAVLLDERIFIVSPFSDFLYQSSDWGLSWDSTSISEFSLWSEDTPLATDGEALYILESDKVHRSTNYGWSFTPFAGSSGIVRGAEWLTGTGPHLFVYDNDQLRRNVNGEWQHADSGLLDGEGQGVEPVFLVSNEDAIYLYVKTSREAPIIYQSTDDGASWQGTNLAEGLPPFSYYITSLALDNGCLYFFSVVLAPDGFAGYLQRRCLDDVMVTTTSPNAAISTLKIFPNPGSDQTMIQLSELDEYDGELLIFNNNGVLVDQQQIDGQNTTLDGSHWPAGQYHVLLRQQDGTLSHGVWTITH